MALTNEQRNVIVNWIKALRSGEYKQGRQGLRNKTKKGDELCCMGVLCELAVKAKVIHKPKEIQGVYVYDQGVSLFPPIVVMKWAGLRTSSGRFEQYHTLVNMNDVSSSSFKTIADKIESELNNDKSELFV